MPISRPSGTSPTTASGRFAAPPRHFIDSKAMAWAAFDRIYIEFCRQGFNVALGSFVQTYGSEQCDASLLMIAIVGFLPAADPRVVGAVAAIEQHLLRDGFVLRYDTGPAADGLPPGAGAFLACSFWLADNYVLQGRIEEARALFGRLIAPTLPCQASQRRRHAERGELCHDQGHVLMGDAVGEAGIEVPRRYRPAIDLVLHPVRSTFHQAPSSLHGPSTMAFRMARWLLRLAIRRMPVIRFRPATVLAAAATTRAHKAAFDTVPIVPSISNA